MFYSDNPPIIHVSLDGYRADYYKRMLNPNLQFVMDTGVRAEYMRSQYPTVTFPNHYTIVTVSGEHSTSTVKPLIRHLDNPEYLYNLTYPYFLACMKLPSDANNLINLSQISIAKLNVLY